MDYLPSDANLNDTIFVAKQEKKLKEFREYLVDKGVVLSMVKVLLSLKYSENPPKQPSRAIRDFFGNYRDPSWDGVDSLKHEIVQEKQEFLNLKQEKQELLLELSEKKRSYLSKQLFRKYEVKNDTVGTKQIIEKLSKSKKFDYEEKLTYQQFKALLEEISNHSPDKEEELIELFTASVEGHAIFADDQENETYVKICETIRARKNKN